MTVVLVQDVEGGSQEIYEQVEAKLHGRTDPPAGRILHTAGPTDTGWRVVDVWESRDALERFRDERLLPAIRDSVGQLPSEPRLQITDVYSMIGS
jgi:hypothetical protein